MTDPVDMIVPLLREIRAENAGLRLAASKLVTGEFEEPIEALERKVRELENQK